MSFTDWLRESRTRLARDGLVDGLRESEYMLRVGAMGRFSALRPGVPIYERDWDVLVVLDACRFDLMAEVADEYDFLEEQAQTTSVGSTSKEWLEKNFSEQYADEMRETVHVTSNIYSEQVLDPNAFAVLDEVWRYGWDDELETIPPRPVTDRAIHHGRTEDADRMIVHYIQPHYPFIPEPDLSPGIRAEGKNIWKQLRDGEVEKDELWNAYRANLHHVLADMSILLNNVDAERVVISADHGNALGEAGVYGHPEGVPLSCLRNVPWITTTASDDGEYEPETDAVRKSDSVREKLSALGYVSEDENRT